MLHSRFVDVWHNLHAVTVSTTPFFMFLSFLSFCFCLFLFLFFLLFVPGHEEVFLFLGGGGGEFQKARFTRLTRSGRLSPDITPPPSSVSVAYIPKIRLVLFYNPPSQSLSKKILNSCIVAGCHCCYYCRRSCSVWEQGMK